MYYLGKSNILGVFSKISPEQYHNVYLHYRMLWSVDSDDPAMFYHRRQCCLTFISALLYTTHIPERYFPGKFDIIGHSHQVSDLLF